jgi:hypothetical protein
MKIRCYKHEEHLQGTKGLDMQKSVLLDVGNCHQAVVNPALRLGYLRTDQAGYEEAMLMPQHQVARQHRAAMAATASASAHGGDGAGTSAGAIGSAGSLGVDGADAADDVKWAKSARTRVLHLPDGPLDELNLVREVLQSLDTAKQQRGKASTRAALCMEGSSLHSACQAVCAARSEACPKAWRNVNVKNLGNWVNIAAKSVPPMPEITAYVLLTWARAVQAGVLQRPDAEHLAFFRAVYDTLVDQQQQPQVALV